MQALTTWEYYDGAFKSVMGAIPVPQADFNRLAIKASVIVRQKTFGNIDESKSISDEVQFCVCDLVEALYSRKERDINSNGTASGIASEKDGNWSVTYESSESVKKADEKQENDIIIQWLANTGLLYSGR